MRPHCPNKTGAAVRFGTDGHFRSRLAWAGGTDPLKVWDAASGVELLPLWADAWIYASVAFMADSKSPTAGPLRIPW